MAQWFCCAIRDSAIDAFGTPVFVVAPGAAVRAFSDEINRKDSAYGAHPGDFELYLLGEFDDSTGSFNCGSPRPLARGSDLVRSKES